MTLTRIPTKNLTVLNKVYTCVTTVTSYESLPFNFNCCQNIGRGST